MFCENCGKQIPDNAAFCSGCGTKNANQVQPEPATEPVAEPVAEPVTEPIAEPVAETVAANSEAPAEAPVEVSAESPAQAQYADPEYANQYPPEYAPEAPKKSKKGIIIAIAAVVLAAAIGVAVYFIFFAGGKMLTNEELEGDWEFKFAFQEIFDMLENNADEIGDAAGSADVAAALTMFGDFETDAEIIFDLTFDDQGNAYMKVDERKVALGVSEFMEDYFTYLENGGIYDMLESQGIDREYIDSMLAMSGMSIDDLIEEARASMPDIDELAESMMGSMGDLEEELKYEIKDKTLRLYEEGAEEEGDYMEYDYDGDDTIELTISQDGLSFSVVMERVD